MLLWLYTEGGTNRILTERLQLSIDYNFMDFSINNNEQIECKGILGPSDLLKNMYHCKFLYPKHIYPGTERIKLYIPYENFPSNCPHLYKDNEPCTSHDDWTLNHTIVEAVNWAVSWLALYENFLETGKTW